MLSCEAFVNHAEELLAADLRWHRRLAIGLHLLLCRPCAVFARQYRLLFGLSARLQSEREATTAEIETVMRAIDETQSTPPR